MHRSDGTACFERLAAHTPSHHHQQKKVTGQATHGSSPQAPRTAGGRVGDSRGQGVARDGVHRHAHTGCGLHERHHPWPDSNDKLIRPLHVVIASLHPDDTVAFHLQHGAALSAIRRPSSHTCRSSAWALTHKEPHRSRVELEANTQVAAANRRQLVGEFVAIRGDISRVPKRASQLLRVSSEARLATNEVRRTQRHNRGTSSLVLREPHNTRAVE